MRDLGKATVGGAKPASAERIVPARVQNHDIEPRSRPFHLAKYQIDIDHLEIDVSLARGIRRDRDQIIRSADLDAVACVVEQRDVRAHQLATEALDDAVEACLVQFHLGLSANHGETQPLQRVRHQQRVALRILQP